MQYVDQVFVGTNGLLLEKSLVTAWTRIVAVLRVSFDHIGIACASEIPRKPAQLGVEMRGDLFAQYVVVTIALIDDLALCFGCPIDVVDLMSVAGPILQQALCKGRVLLKKRPGLYARLMLKMW